MWPYSAPSPIDAHKSNGDSTNLAITLLIIFVKLHTVLLVLLYRDQTLFGHHGPACSYTNPMLLGNVTQEGQIIWWQGTNSPTAPVLLLNVAQENSDTRRQKGGRVSELDRVPELEQTREQSVSKFSLRRHFDQMYRRLQTDGPRPFSILTTTFV